MQNVGKRIKERRVKLGISAEELAPMVGLSPATIYRYENGGIKSVNTNKLEPFAKALNTTESYLMGWIDDPDIKTLTRDSSSIRSAMDALVIERGLNSEDMDLIEDIFDLSREQRQALRTFVSTLVKAARKEAKEFDANNCKES